MMKVFLFKSPHPETNDDELPDNSSYYKPSNFCKKDPGFIISYNHSPNDGARDRKCLVIRPRSVWTARNNAIDLLHNLPFVPVPLPVPVPETCLRTRRQPNVIFEPSASA